MALRPEVYTTGNLVDKHINSAYDVVKIVSDNIADVLIAATNITDINTLAPIANSITIVADAVASVVINAADITNINLNAASIDDINTVAADITAGKIDAAIAAAIQTALDATATAEDRAEVESLYDQFDDRYLGSKGVTPTLDNDGDELITGAMYFYTVDSTLYVWTGTVWATGASTATATAAAASAAAALVSENNAAISESNADADATQTAADRVVTTQDAIDTAADVVLTGLDVDSTNADVVLTGLDVSYSAEWANKAEDLLVSANAGGDAVNDYSSLHWANKAAASATLAATVVAEVGQSILWNTDIPPTGFFEEDGSELLMASYDALYAIIKSQFGLGVAVGTFTTTNATNIIDVIGHGLVNNEPIEFTNSGGALPAELSTYTTYYVSVVDVDSFQVSLTAGGAIVEFTDDGTGTHSYHNSFLLEDTRGEFIRGWDNGAGNDPDAATRTDRGDGTIGDFIGTKQGYQIQSHLHAYRNGGGAANTAYAGTASNNNYGTNNSNSTGGNETRPRNTSKMYAIKY